MTDDLMDARLHEAGERWRTATQPSTDSPRTTTVVDLVTQDRRRRRTRWSLITSAAAVAALAAGVLVFLVTRSADHRVPPGTGPSSLAIVGSTWHLLHVVDPAGQQSAAVSARLQITNGGTLLTGSDGCNSFSGAVVTTRDSMTITGPVSRTEIACQITTDETASIDAFFAGTIQWRVTGAQLVLSKSGAGSLVYGKPVPATATDPDALTGTWRLIGIGHAAVGKDGITSSQSAQTTVTFTIDSVSVREPCDVRAGVVVLGAGTVDFDGLAGPGIGGCDRISAQHQISGVLTGHFTWQIDDGVLSMTKGSLTLTFAKV